MKYERRRSYTYPVLCPHNDDYVEGVLHTRMETPEIHPETNQLSACVEFLQIESTIENLVLSEKAKCACMLYCKKTLFRRAYQSRGVEANLVDIYAPANELVDIVEIHPFIVARETIEISHENLHPEYKGLTFRIQPGRPIAFDQTWRFRCQPPVAPIRSIFELDTDPNLADNEFDVNLEDRYIRILANEATRSNFDARKNVRSSTLPSIYLSALMEALIELKYRRDPDSESSKLWETSILTSMNALNLDIGNEEIDGNSIFEIAQKLLYLPFRYVVEDSWDEDLE